MESTVQNKISVSFNDSMSFLSAIALEDLSHKNLIEVNHAFLQPSAGVQWIGCLSFATVSSHTRTHTLASLPQSTRSSPGDTSHI